MTDKQLLIYQNAIEKSLNSFFHIEEKRKDDAEDYLYAVFFSEKSLIDYRKGYDSADVLIWKTDDTRKYGFSYLTLQEGVWMRADGTGEPDTYEYVEYKKTYITLIDVLKSVTLQHFTLTLDTMLDGATELILFNEENNN